MLGNKKEIVFNKLFLQCQESLGVSLNVKNKDDLIKYRNWLAERNKLKDMYLNELDNSGVIYGSDKCIEIGKSFDDSIVIDKSSGILTPYTDTFNKHDLDKHIINGTLSVDNGNAYVLSNNKLIDFDKWYDTIVTQNSYDNFNYTNLAELYNLHKYNMVVGIYGSIYDFNFEYNVNSLKAMKKLLCDHKYIERFSIYDENYYYFIASNGAVKKFIK